MSATATTTTASPPQNIYADPTFRERIFARLPGNYFAAAVARDQLCATHAIVLPEKPCHAYSMAEIAQHMWSGHSLVSMRQRAVQILGHGNDVLKGATPVLFEQSHQVSDHLSLPSHLNILLTGKPDELIKGFFGYKGRIESNWCRVKPDRMPDWEGAPYYFLQVGDQAWTAQINDRQYFDDAIRWQIRKALEATGETGGDFWPVGRNPEAELNRAKIWQAREARIAAEEKFKTLQQEHLDGAIRLGKANQALIAAEHHLRQMEGR